MGGLKEGWRKTGGRKTSVFVLALSCFRLCQISRSVRAQKALWQGEVRPLLRGHPSALPNKASRPSSWPPVPSCPPKMCLYPSACRPPVLRLSALQGIPWPHGPGVAAGFSGDHHSGVPPSSGPKPPRNGGTGSAPPVWALLH